MRYRCLAMLLAAATIFGCSKTTEVGDGTGGSAGLDGTSGTGGTAGAAGTDGTAGSAGISGSPGQGGSAAEGGAGSAGIPGGGGEGGSAAEGGSGVAGAAGTAGTAGTAGSAGGDAQPEPCDPALCGPAPGMPSRICPDGSVAGPVCVRLDANTCGWRITDCPPVAGYECGGSSSYACDLDQYCALPAGTCGEGDTRGTCETRPQMCTMEYAPVCGCDGQTYGNDCGAASAGESIRYTGECGTVVCTYGMDQTCNDSPIISSLHGVCLPDGTCDCNDGFAMNPDTGLCL